MLKQTIEADFITAFKAKDTFTKNTLGFVKAKFIEYEKSLKGELNDGVVIDILRSELKKKNDTIDLISKETNDKAITLLNDTKREIEIISKYLPKLFTIEEIKEKFINFVNEKKPISILKEGMAYFNSTYKGQFDNKILKSVIDDFTKLDKG